MCIGRSSREETCMPITVTAAAAAAMSCRETGMGGGGCRVGRTQNLGPGDLDPSPGSATGDLSCLVQVKLQMWALFPYLQNERAGQDYLKAASPPFQVSRA